MFWRAAACAEHGCAVAKNVHKRYLVHLAGYKSRRFDARAIRRRPTEGGSKRQTCVRGHHSGRRHDRLRDPRRVRRLRVGSGDGGVDRRRNM